MATTSSQTIAASNNSFIQYSIAPTYYTDLAAGADLSGYSFYQSALCDEIDDGPEALGDTDWMWVVYKSSGAPTEARHTFVYNTVTEEVVRYYELLSEVYYYWTQEEVLASFASSGAVSFFTAIGKTREVSLYSAGELDTVDGAVSGWTAYHDALVEELKGLIDKYNWQDSSVIANRVQSVQEELRRIGSTLRDAPLQALLADFEQARVDVEDLNEERYDQLTAPVGGLIDATAVMSYPQLAEYMRLMWYDSLTTMYEEAEITFADLDQDIVDEYDDLSDEIQEMLTALGRTADPVGMKKVELFHTVHVMRIQEMVRRVSNMRELASQKRGWLAEAAGRLAVLHQLAPGVVERRTDMGPSLADVANLTMNIGRGQASQEMLNSFSPTQFIASAGSSSSGLGGMLQDLTAKK